MEARQLQRSSWGPGQGGATCWATLHLHSLEPSCGQSFPILRSSFTPEDFQSSDLRLSLEDTQVKDVN